MMPDSAPFFGICLPKRRMATEDSAGMSGISQAYSISPVAAWWTASVP